jgi:hypothetical protein
MQNKKFYVHLNEWGIELVQKKLAETKLLRTSARIQHTANAEINPIVRLYICLCVMQMRILQPLNKKIVSNSKN